MLRRIWMVIILFQLSLLQLWGLDPDKRIDNYLLDQWEAPDGLPSNTINSITQTADGYLWLAASNGLLRFDGIKFTEVSFFGKEELSPPGHPEPFTLTVNREGALWIGSSMGLTRFFNGRFKTFTTAQGLTENSIRRIAVDMKGNLWISFGSVRQLFKWFCQFDIPSIYGSSAYSFVGDYPFF